MNKAGLYCSFCGKSESEVKHIVEGPGKVGICDECSELIESIMEPYRHRPAAASTSTEAVGVKALEWVDRYDGDDIRGGVTVLATSILGVYQVWGDGSWSNRDRFITGHGNLDDGLAAAQADFEARIRSCLTPPTPKVTADEAEEQNAVTEKAWQPIETAPKHPVVEGWTCGPDIYLRPSWGGWTVGRWVIDSTHEDGGWFEFLGEDGPQDEQPTHWQPLAAPSETFAALSARSP